MPKIAGRDVRGEFLALQLFTVGKSVSPTEINTHVGRGDYAAKYISFLRNRHGFEFTVQKDGRTVVSYTMVSEPSNAAEVRAKADPAVADVAKRAKAVFTKAAKASKPVKAKLSKQTPVAKAARNVLKERADKQADALLAELGMKNAGEVHSGSYSVDPGWDDLDGIDPMSLINHD